jgi:hypothetical protein
MSLVSKVNSLFTSEMAQAYKPGTVYTVAAPGPAYTIFSVSGGAVEIVTFGARITAAAVGATTLAMTFNTVAGDAGAVAINGAVGTVVFYGLNVAATTINAAAVPKTVATLTSMIVGTQPAGPGLIVATFGIGTSVTCEFFCVYRKLSPNARVY